MSCIMSDELKTLSRRADTLSDMIEQLEYRVTAVEDNYGRALAALEDQILDLERASVGERVARLDEIMESPDPAETRAGGLRDMAVLYRCNACDPGDGLPPCVCLLSQNRGVPTECIFGTRRASDVPAAWVVVDQDLGAIILDGIQGGA